jgi:hypothetical protein
MSCVAQDHRQHDNCDVDRDRDCQHRDVTHHTRTLPFSISSVNTHVEVGVPTRNPMMESESYVEQRCIEDPPVSHHTKD